MKEIKLTPTHLGLSALVDDADWPTLSPYTWHVKIKRHKNGRVDKYAARWEGGGHDRRQILMHHELLERREGLEIDHSDGNGLNNQRHNIRYATRSQNQANAPLRRDSTSGFKGVHFDATARGKKWLAKIQRNKRRITIGRFATAEDAARAYDSAAVKLFGEFAKTNASLEPT